MARRNVFKCQKAALRLIQTALLIVFAIGSTTIARADGLTPRDIAGLDYVGSATISPDGSMVAYTVSRPRNPYKVPAEYEEEFKDGSPETELHLMRFDSGETRLFIPSEAKFGSIAWTPDGKHLSFAAKRDGDKNRSLYLLPTDGGEARKVMAHETDIGSYSWSPDGNRVAFIAGPEDDKDREKLEKKGFKAEVYEELNRPDGLWVAELSKGMEKHRKIELEGHVLSVNWSPVGNKILVRRAPTTLIDDDYMSSEMVIVDADSGEISAKIVTVGKLGAGHWSPDGQNVAIIGVTDVHDPAEGRLLIVGSGGGDVREVLENYPGHIADIGWQGNDTIMFVGHEGCEAVFGEVKIDGSGMKKIVPPGGPILRNVSLSKDGQRAAFVADAPGHYRELFVMAHGDRAPRRMTITNSWLSEKTLGKQDVVRYTARDGLDIEGILIRPVDEVAGQRYPLIVVVHGGPEAHEANGWMTHYSRPGQMAAAKGYAVFYPNYRGSTGRGVEFSMKSQGRYGKEEFDDVVDGVKHLVSIGLVDEKRVGITGGSYGGYASAWGATKLTGHFAASVMFVGISEMFSKFGTTDIPNEMHLVHARTWPWENWELFRESSPVTYVDQARTPILILHGKEDTRVHPSQSMTLYRYLKTYGKVPVRLVMYPGEGHGNRKAASRLDYCLRMFRWFDHYLAEGNHRADSPPPMDIDYDLPKKKKDDEKKGDSEVEKSN